MKIPGEIGERRTLVKKRNGNFANKNNQLEQKHDIVTTEKPNWID